MSQRYTRSVSGAVLVAIGTIAVFALMLVRGSSMAIVGLLAIGGVLAISVGTLLLGAGGGDEGRLA